MRYRLIVLVFVDFIQNGGEGLIVKSPHQEPQQIIWIERPEWYMQLRLTRFRTYSEDFCDVGKGV